MVALVDKVRAALEAAAGRYPGLAYAVLFGSAARGTAHARSDVDVAVRGVTGWERLGLEADLADAVGAPVQVVPLDDAPPALRYRVFRDGIVLQERDRGARVHDQTRAVLDYLDYRPLEQRAARAVLAGGGG